MITAATLIALAMMPANLTDNDWSVFPGDGSYAINSDHAHDPHLFEFGDTFYCVSTTHNAFCVIRSTKDFQSWKIEGPILPDTPAWLKKAIPEHQSVWAPMIVQVGSSLRMYYSASRRFGANESYIGFAQCDHFDPARPTAGWEDKGLVVESQIGKQDFNAIDPEVRIDREGRQWLIFGSYFAGIFAGELDPASGKLAGPLKLVARNTASKENALEGATVCERDGYYYLFVSYGLAAQGVASTYQIMVGRSKSMDGPYVDARGVEMADGGHVNVLKTSSPMFSPGHCEVIRDHTGRYLMSYHYYDARQFWHGNVWGMPRMQVRELLWGEDGWPLPGFPLEYPAALAATPREDLTGKWLIQFDFTQPRNLEFRADGTIYENERVGVWKKEGGEIEIRIEKPRPIDARLQLAYGDNYAVGRGGDGSIIRGTRIGVKQ